MRHFTASILAKRASLVALAVFAATACSSTSSPASSSTLPKASPRYCTAARHVRAAYEVIAGFNAATTLQQVKVAYEVATASVDSAAAASPSTVSVDWEAIRSVADSGNQVVQAASDLASATRDLQQVLAAAKTSDAAARQVDTYTSLNCGFRLSSPSATPS
jgi:hypothetical protein